MIEDTDELRRLAEPWRRLEPKGCVAPFYSSPEFFLAWRERFGQSACNGVLAVFEYGEAVAVFPLMFGRRWSGPALRIHNDLRPGDEAFYASRRRFRFLPISLVSNAQGAESGSARFSWRCRAGRERACAAALMAFLAEEPRWNMACLPIDAGEFDLWRDVATESPFVCLSRPHLRTMYQRREASWDGLLRGRSRHFRRRFREAEIQAERAGMRFVNYEDEEARKRLPAFFQIGRNSWKATGRDGLDFIVPPTDACHAFYDDILAGNSGLVSLLSLLEDDRGACGGMLSLLSEDTLVTCLTYYDPRTARISTGRLVIRAAFQWAQEKGARNIDFNATHPWVDPFADRKESVHGLFLFRNNPPGRAFAVAGRRLGGLVPISQRDAFASASAEGAP